MDYRDKVFQLKRHCRMCKNDPGFFLYNRLCLRLQAALTNVNKKDSREN